MMKKRFLVALGALSGALAACSSDMNATQGGSGASSGTSNASPGSGAGPSSGGTGSGATGSGASSGTVGTTGGTGAGGATGGTGGDSGGSSGMQGVAAATCVPGIPTTTQIPRMLNRQFDNTVRDLLGVTTIASEDNKAPSQVLFADFEGPMVADAWRIYQSVASEIAHQVMTGSNKSMFINCDPAAANCLSDTIKAFGRKAFRRPLTDDEVARFLKLGQTTPAGTPADVAETTLMAFLVSPSFLYLPELQTKQDPSGKGIELSSYEVATRLAYFLWGSVPDDMLNQAADADQLQTADQILAQAKRMIADKDKTGPLIAAFHRDWAQMNNGAAHWWKIDHDPTLYPLYSADKKSVYQSELDDFFEDVAYSGGSFKDLFLSNVGFVNKDNAAIYGLDPSQYGADLTKVELNADQRPGFMTRVGFLSSYSHYDSTSPILRGAFITVNMLGVDPGPPLPGAAQKTAPPGDYKTNREMTDALVNQDASCRGCHVSVINPSGYVLENYDAIGKWQTTDPLGGPIDSKATVTFSADDVKEISTPLELMQEISIQPVAKEMYAQKWVSYAFGRPSNNNDQCIVDQLDTNLSKDGYSLLDVLADLTQADSFRIRARENP